jgi:4-amino-4-deoxy-L-arabinose transferase-like glycosyltransferase
MKHSSLAQDRVTKLACICIFFIGAYFRFSGLYESIWSSAYDETRDTIVASHFIKYGEFLTRGPNVTTPYLLNPPTYYYFISGLLWIGGSLWGAKVMWACMLTMTIVLAYIVGCRVWDRKLGIITHLLLPFTPRILFPCNLSVRLCCCPYCCFLC